jgi:hypothetical protein
MCFVWRLMFSFLLFSVLVFLFLFLFVQFVCLCIGCQPFILLNIMTCSLHVLEKKKHAGTLKLSFTLKLIYFSNVTSKQSIYHWFLGIILAPVTEHDRILNLTCSIRYVYFPRNIPAPSFLHTNAFSFETSWFHSIVCPSFAYIQNVLQVDK